MYLVGFALLSVAGAWFAWRSNPMYSLGATVRFVVVVGLSVAAVLGAVIATVNATTGQPAAVSFGTLAVVLLAGTMSLIWVIMQVSAPKTAPLPASAILVRVHRAKLLSWLRRFGWTVLVTGMLAVVIPGDAKYVVYTLGGMVVFIGLIMLFAGYFAALQADRSLTSVESAAWVHWRYTPAQWKEWSDVQVTRLEAVPPQWQWRRDWKKLAIPLVAVAVGVFVFDPGDWLWKAAYVIGISGLITGLVVLSSRDAKNVPGRVRRRLMSAPPEAYFGAGGVFADGVYTQWLTAGNYLLSAGIDERAPRSLTFVFEVLAAGQAPSEVRQGVLIPPGAEADIATLATALSAACPSARIALT